MGTKLNSEFSEKEAQMAKKHLNAQHPQPSREMQIKITQKSHLLPAIMSKINNTAHAGENAE